MGNVSRPLVALLAATVVFFALWVVALKPGSKSNSSGHPGVGALQPAINAAHNAVTTQNNSNAASAGESTTPAATGQPVTTTSPATSSHRHATAGHRSHAAAGHNTAAHSRTRHAARSHPRPSTPTTPAARLRVVQKALDAHKVVAMLFYNPSAPDDDAVKAELASVPTRAGRVVKLEIPLPELPSYTSVISQVPVNFSPTLVIIDRAQQASTITGFTDSYEISQRIDQALAVKP